MRTSLPAWPTSIPRIFKPVATFHNPRLAEYSASDLKAILGATERLRRQEAVQCSQSYRQLLFNRAADYTALASFTSDATLISGNAQPVLWHPLLDFTQVNRQFSLFGKGVVSCTGTPTYTFRVSIKNAAADITGTTLGASAAITTASGITNQLWEFRLDFVMTIAGIGSGNTTLSAAGWVKSPGGFAAPYEYSLIPSQGALATFTATTDLSADQYLNVSVACSASSSSNTIQIKHLTLEALN